MKKEAKAKAKSEQEASILEAFKLKAIEAYKTNCVFHAEGQCNFTGTPCGINYCSHLRTFIDKLNTKP